MTDTRYKHLSLIARKNSSLGTICISTPREIFSVYLLFQVTKDWDISIQSDFSMNITWSS